MTDIKKIAQEFFDYLNHWHSQPEIYDDALDAQIHGWYANILNDKKRQVWAPYGVPYFSPSSADADPRSLYEKLRGAKRENALEPPHQGRQKRIGTAIGDVIQRDILFAEKHLESPRFIFDRNEYGEPLFENFAKVSKTITHNGKTFALLGTPDGILLYIADDGSTLRIGLEVKSKQTTYAKTSPYSMRNGPDTSHVEQCIVYSEMYNVDYYLILYVNGARKSWDMTPEEFEKNPDIAVFGIEITDEMRNRVFDGFADILTMAEAGTPPNTDLFRWKFNNFKNTIAAALTDDELHDLKRQVTRVSRSNLQAWKIKDIENSYHQIIAMREELGIE